MIILRQVIDMRKLIILVLLLWPFNAFSVPSNVNVPDPLADGESITITGSGFGSGPNVLIFDDFESGTNGVTIPVGAIAKYGTWTSAQSSRYYSNVQKISGNLSFASDYAATYTNFLKKTFPAQTNQVYISYWAKVTGKWPGADSPSGKNWKVIWMYQNNTGDQDFYFPGYNGTDWLISGNEAVPDYFDYIGEYSHALGTWKRGAAWFKGSSTTTTADGEIKFWHNGASGWTQIAKTGMYPNLATNEYWKQIDVNGFGRVTTGCITYFDDVYIAVGPNAQARVEIGNANTYSASTQLTILTPTSWSTSSITAQVNVGQFSPGQQAWLYVIDSTGAVSTGVPVTFGEAAPDTTPPVLVSTDPADGATNVTKNTTRTAIFDEALNVSSVGTGSVTSNCGTLSSVTASGSVVTILPSAETDSQNCTITFSTSISNLAGYHPESPITFSYTTAESPAQTCAESATLCEDEGECLASWPAYYYCPAEAPACKATPCVGTCSFENWQLCDNQVDAEAADLFWYVDSQRTIEQPLGMIGSNYIGNPNLTSWSGDMPVSYSSYKTSNVSRDSFGARLFDGGHIIPLYRLEAGKTYAFVYNIYSITGAVKIWWEGAPLENTIDIEVLAYDAGTHVIKFTMPAEPIDDHGLYIGTTPGSDVVVNNFLLMETTNDTCSSNADMCQGETECLVAGWIYYNDYCSSETPLLYDNFNDLNATGWTTAATVSSGTPTWTAADGTYRQTADIKGLSNSFYNGAHAYWGAGSAWTDYQINTRITPNTNVYGWDTIGVLFRYTDSSNYYRFSMSFVGGWIRLEKRVAGVYSTIAVGSINYDRATDHDLVIDVIGPKIIASVDGVPLLGADDSSLATGTVALYNSGVSGYDNVAVLNATTETKVVITTPVAYSIATEDTDTTPTNLDVTAIAINVPVSGTVTLSLDGLASSGELTVEPYTHQFTSVSSGNHSVSAVVIDAVDVLANDTNYGVGMSGISFVALGDSITRGVGDNIITDNISTDGRTASYGFEPILNNLLSTAIQKEVSIANGGIGGIKADEGSNGIANELLRHPSAQYWLILLGTNDSVAGTVTADYKSYIEDMVVAILAAGKTPLLAKVPYRSDSSQTVLDRIIAYNVAIDELITTHALPDVSPDLYSVFEATPALLYDGVHPTGGGYQSMAASWFSSLIDPTDGIFSVVAGESGPGSFYFGSFY